jgi:hypothetical protein
MVKHNPNNKILNQINIYIYISWWIGENLQENNIDNYILKNENIFPKKLKLFLICMKCVVFTLCM